MGNLDKGLGYWSFIKVMENQGFRGKDVVGVYTAMLVVGLALFFLVKNTAQSMGGAEAHREMAQISRQILSDGLASLDSDGKSDRSPASLEDGLSGRIGQDPWGNPYYFKVYEVGTLNRAVVLWSSGPNGNRETNESDVLLSTSGRPLRAVPRGDDLAHVEFGL